MGDDWMWIGGGEWRGRKGSGRYPGVRVLDLREIER